VTGPARLKLIAAVLLLAALALPQYTCARFRAPDGGVWSQMPANADSSQYQPFTERHYALENFDPANVVMWLTILAFGWPLAVFGVRRRAGKGRVSAGLWWLEPLLAAGSGYFIFALSSLGTRAIGAYLGLGACLLYIGAWAVELRARFRRGAV
jgi:hypothetical protein